MQREREAGLEQEAGLRAEVAQLAAALAAATERRGTLEESVRLAALENARLAQQVDLSP